MEFIPSAGVDTEGLVAKLAATVRRLRLPLGVSCEDCVQETVMRWLMWRDIHRQLSAKQMHKVAFGILRNLMRELRRKGACGAVGVPCDAGIDVSQMSSKAVTCESTEARILEDFESWLRSQLCPLDASLLLAVRLDRMDWRSAAQSLGIVEERHVEAARKRIARFLSDPEVMKSVRKWL